MVDNGSDDDDKGSDVVIVMLVMLVMLVVLVMLVMR